MGDAMQPTVGFLLKQRREELESSLTELATKTRIRKAYLEALERDAFEVLPGDAYRIGFLRSYADALGLETDCIVRQWREQAGGEADQSRTEIPVASPGPTGSAFPRSRRRMILQILSMLVVTGLVVFYLSTGRNKKTALAHPAATDVTSQPSSGAVAPDVSVSHYRPAIPGEASAVKPEVIAPLSAGAEEGTPTQQFNSIEALAPEAKAGGLVPPEATGSEQREAK